jgi:hypothetical protein
VRGPRVTRATAGYPERDSSRYILNGVSFKDSEASDKSCRIATQAALSRRKPIQDAADFWVQRRESADIGDSTPAQDRHNVDTGGEIHLYSDIMAGMTRYLERLQGSKGSQGGASPSGPLTGISDNK